MKIHEYQGEELLRRYGVPVPLDVAAESVADAKVAIAKVQEESGSDVVVVKAQIHAGGRGKAGGVVPVRSVFPTSASGACGSPWTYSCW